MTWYTGRWTLLKRISVLHAMILKAWIKEGMMDTERLKKTKEMEQWKYCCPMDMECELREKKSLNGMKGKSILIVSFS